MKITFSSIRAQHSEKRSLFELHSDAESRQYSGPCCSHRCPSRVVFLIEEILGSGEYLDALADRLRRQSIHGEVAVQRKLILVVVELTAPKPPLRCESEYQRIAMTPVRGQLA